jgi:hypothetical protein
LDRLHIRVHLWWVSRWIRQLFVVSGARCPLTKPVVTAVELQAPSEPHCSRGVQPGGIYVYVVQREPTPGGPGSGLRLGRKRCLCQLQPAAALVLCTNAGARSARAERLLVTMADPWGCNGNTIEEAGKWPGYSKLGTKKLTRRYGRLCSD